MILVSSSDMSVSQTIPLLWTIDADDNLTPDDTIDAEDSLVAF